MNLPLIQKTMKPVEIPLWRQIQRETFTNWETLADFLELDKTQRETILTKTTFPLSLPLRLAKKISKGTLNDPILKQFLPHTDETKITAGFQLDPVGDEAARRSKKLLHKYDGRALLLCTSACAMHCRYCFRQNYAYSQEDSSFDAELKIIAEDPTIHELILSGGDPLSLSNKVLEKLLLSLAEIKQIKRIRFHTRFPVGIPERIDAEFLTLIQSIPKQFWFVLHINHPTEIDSDLIEKTRALQRLGVIVLNQGVLLRGVNDDLTTLKNLCETLVDHGIIPYYLSQLDRVKGTAHFEVPVVDGLKLMQELTKHLPGYAIPRYIQEEAGCQSKTILF